MKFYIFGTKDDGSKLNCKIKDNLSKNPEDYDKTLEQFNEIISAHEYTDVYFVIDFGMCKRCPFKYIPEYNIKNGFSFIIISEYHFGYEPKFKNDNMIIFTKGFKEEFNSNKSAFEKFLYCLESNIYATLTAKDAYDNNEYIADTHSILSKKPNKIRRFLFEK